MQLKLIYFNARGLAETSRILLALAQVNYTDFRFPFEVIDPINHVYKREEFDLAKKSGKLDSSMGKLPILEITHENGDVTIIPQSKAIERFLAKKYCFMGDNEFESAKIDAVCECIRDIKDRFIQKIRNADDDVKMNYFTKELNNDLESLANILDKKSPYAIGTKLSLADITIYHLVTLFYDNKVVLDIAGNIPKLRDIVMKVATKPEIRVWNQDRPKTLF